RTSPDLIDPASFCPQTLLHRADVRTHFLQECFSSGIQGSKKGKKNKRGKNFASFVTFCPFLLLLPSASAIFAEKMCPDISSEGYFLRRLVTIPFDCLLQAFIKTDVRTKPELSLCSRSVETPARLSVRLSRIPDQLTLESTQARDLLR